MLARVDNELNLNRDWRLLKALAYTPLDEVVTAFEELIRDADFDRDFWADFLEYLEKYYIGVYRLGLRGNGQFKRESGMYVIVRWPMVCELTTQLKVGGDVESRFLNSFLRLPSAH